MRAEASTWRRTAARCLIASTLVTAALGAGCRTANVGGKTDPDPTMKAIVAPAEAAEIAALPDGAAKVLVAERCLTVPQRRAHRAAAERRRGLGPHRDADADVGHAHPGRRSSRARRVSRTALGPVTRK